VSKSGFKNKCRDRACDFVFGLHNERVAGWT